MGFEAFPNESDYCNVVHAYTLINNSLNIITRQSLKKHN